MRINPQKTVDLLTCTKEIYAETVPFHKNFHTRKLGEVTAFYAVEEF